MVRVTPSTHAELVRVAAAIQVRTGKNVSLDAAINELIGEWQERNNEPGQINPVIIKQSGGGMYLQSSSVATSNFGMTHHRREAMVFDNPNQAKAFLHKSGREVGDWILEPVNRIV